MNNKLSVANDIKACEHIGRGPGYISDCLKHGRKAVGSDGSVYDVIVGGAS